MRRPCRGGAGEGLLRAQGARTTASSRWIEGPPLEPGERCLVVEDVVTTGGSAIHAIERVRDEGFEVAGVVTVLDRQAGGADAIRAAVGDVPYTPLTMIDDVRSARSRLGGAAGVALREPGVDQPARDRVGRGQHQRPLATGRSLHLLALEPADLRQLVVARRRVACSARR